MRFVFAAQAAGWVWTASTASTASTVCADAPWLGWNLRFDIYQDGHGGELSCLPGVLIE